MRGKEKSDFMQQYRNLTQQERAALEARHCTAENWDNVLVAEDFTPEYVSDVKFSGRVKIGSQHREFDQPGGFKVHSGIYSARLFNCTIGNDVYIDRVHNYIANYTIGDDAFIENTNLIVTDGETTFGNGVSISVMNEGGGREIPIFDGLSAHLAYILALYRHDRELIAAIQGMIDEYVQSRRATVGVIGNGVRIINCGTIKNVYIGDCATLMGVSKLRNGSINSNSHAPVHLGSGVKCTDFILSSGVDITDSTLVSNCFIGQGTVMGKHYSALDSLFFANCQGFHGEATAIFAGPYTVSHHKSSLLIAGMFSFLNAGSGSNQRNHMYKLGPIHQGIAERGSKTTSDSYLLWPARIGAFTLVMGRHTKHSDTSDLPFSYLIENATESYLVPAVNLRSVGTIRDAQKWPKRDNRKDPVHLDQINFNLLSPYTIQKMMRGVDVLRRLSQLAGGNNEVYSYQNCKIRNSSLQKGVDLYNMAITKFLGNSLISRLDKDELQTLDDMHRLLRPTTPCGSGEWVDLSGLIAPQGEVDRLIADIKQGNVTLSGIQERFVEMHSNYYEYEWTWAYDKLMKIWDKPLEEVDRDDVKRMVCEWKDAVVTLDRMLYNDAKKEFDLNAKTGFGVDGDESVKSRDFESVRGRFDSNPFVCEVLNHIDRKTKLGDAMIGRLDRMC